MPEATVDEHHHLRAGEDDVWRPARERAGLPDVTIYDLRHSFISLMQEAGVPVADLAAATGHVRVSTLQDVYTHALGRSFDRMRSAFGT